MSGWINVQALWQILVAGLICGAGLPALFALGLKALSLSGPNGAATSDDQIIGGSRVGMVAAVACFAVVVAAAIWGVYFIASA